MTEANQNIYESRYKSSHSIKTNEVWNDNISFAATFNIAKDESIINEAVTLHEVVSLTEILGSNGQAYHFVNGNGKFIRPFIAPEDVVNSLTNETSIGYTLQLYKGDGVTRIYPTDGNWVVNYYSGIISFMDGYTPSILGWGNIKASFFEYTGKYVSDYSEKYYKTVVCENKNIIFNKNTVGEATLDLSSLLITETITNVEFNDVNKKLSITRYDGNNYDIDLSSLSEIANGINDVKYNTSTTNLTFYRNNASYLVLNLNDIIVHNDNSFVNIQVDTLTNDLIFTRASGLTYSIPLESLQDRTAYNDIVLSGKVLNFKKQDGDLTTIDLSSLIDYSGITDVQFNPTTNIIKYFKDGVFYTEIDLKSIIDTLTVSHYAFTSVHINNNNLIFTSDNGTTHSISFNELQNKTVYNNVELVNNVLMFTKLDGDLTSVDLTSMIINNGITDVNFNPLTNVIKFHKNNMLYFSIDLHTIFESMINQTNPFIDSSIDEIGGLLKFTRKDGTFDTIQIQSLQDRTAYNDAILEGNVLIIHKQDGDLTEIDFTNLIGPDNSRLSIMISTETVERVNSDLLLGNLITDITVDGMISKFGGGNINMTAMNTTPTNNLACSIPLSLGNILHSSVCVFINGVQVVLGIDNTCECYFSDDGGITKKLLNNIVPGDLLYWNYVNNIPIAGYNLNTIDKITFTYLSA